MLRPRPRSTTPESGWDRFRHRVLVERLGRTWAQIAVLYDRMYLLEAKLKLLEEHNGKSEEGRDGDDG